MENPAQSVSARFTPREVELRHRDRSASIGFRLRGYGYGERLDAVTWAHPVRAGSRVEYRRGPLTEWYVNRPEGLEQGFILATPPESGMRRGRLTIAIEVTGGRQPALSPAGDAVLFEEAGTTWLRYSKLEAWDATGRTLPSGLEVRGSDVRLAIDDAGAVYPVTIDPLVQQAKLTPGDTATGDYFGHSMALDGETAVIGAYGKGGQAGAAYVFVRSSGVWTQEAKLTPSDPAANDEFGFSVAVNGNTAVVGAPTKANGTRVAQGSAYVFTRTGTTWTQQRKLAATDGAAGDRFGFSVAISTDTALVGAYTKANGSATGQGAAYVFQRSGTSWSQQAKLLASDGALYDYFGAAAALTGDTAVIGAPYKATSQGAAYVFTRSGAVWSQQAKLVASDGAGNDTFGYSVTLNGGTAVIGAPAAGGPGAAYVFVSSGSTWSQQSKLTPSDGAAGDNFGISLALVGDTAAVGASAKANSKGAAYAFGRNGTTWMQLSAATASDGATGDTLGSSVAVIGDNVLVGASQNAGKGAVYVFAPGVASVLTVASNPPGLPFTATGTGCPTGTLTTPVALPAGASCSIAFTSPALNAAGNVNYTFTQWNDGITSNPRAFPTVWQDITFTAQFVTRYLLTVSATPAPGGQLTGGGWYTPSSTATVAALPNPGFTFNGFSGDLNGTANPQNVAMNAPKTVTGGFLPLPGAALSTLITSKSGPQNARTWTVAVTNSGPGMAYAPQIVGLMLTQTYGTACAPVRLNPAFPVAYLNLSVGGTAVLSVQFDFTGCPANARFSAAIASVANSGAAVGAAILANQTM